MPNELHRLEESLKEFLSGPQGDCDNSKNAHLYKYNNLKILMEPSHEKTPHCIVRIGISESMYNIITGERLAGGLERDERLIRRWIDKPFVKESLNIAWREAKKIKIVSMKNDDEDDN